jgi:hypothetical protein
MPIFGMLRSAHAELTVFGANRILGDFGLTYAAKWQPINNALQRIVAAGDSKKQAKQDLCQAIADREIEIRLHLAADHLRPAKVLAPPALDIPSHLSPADIDWPSSQPSRHSKLFTGPSQRLGQPTSMYIQNSYDLMGRTVDLIEVRVADVTKVFCNTESQPEAKPTAGSPTLRANKSAKSTGVAQAITALWPERRVDGLTTKDKYRQTVEWLKARNLSIPSLRTVQRALKQLDR